MKKALILLTCMVYGLIAMAEDMYFEGTVGKWPIVLALNYSYDTGRVSGRYAYLSTLKKQGKGADSYLYFEGTATMYNPLTSIPKPGLVKVRDAKGNLVETWKEVFMTEAFLGYQSMTLTGDVYLKDGKKLELSADADYNKIKRYFE